MAMLILLVILLPWIGALAVWLTADRTPEQPGWVALFFSALAAVASLMLLFAPTPLDFFIPVGGVFGDFTFHADGLGVFLTAVATLIGALAVVFSFDYMRGQAQLSRYYAFILFFIGGMAGLVLANNLLLVFFFWEITALCSYALISFHNDDPKAVAGGIKALVMTQLGGVGLLIGALLLYSQTGSYDLQAFIRDPGVLSTRLLSLMAYGFLAAAAAKSAQFPFQTWLPDAMEAPSPISALIHAATMVNAGVYLLARFYPAFESVAGWRVAVMLVGAISALLAALMALTAFDLKRVLAYSTVSQLGYMVYAVGAGGIFASQFHLMSHSVFKALLFLAAGAVIHAVGTRDMRQMGGLGRSMRLTQGVFLLGAMALAGLPILNGFWSKELVLEAGLQGGPIALFTLMILTAGLTALYTFRCVWMVFFGDSQPGRHLHDAPVFMRWALLPLAGGTLFTTSLAGGFSRSLALTLPAHAVHAESTVHWLLEVVNAPATYLALAVVLLGLTAWWQRERLTVVAAWFGWARRAAENTFGFDALNTALVGQIHRVSEILRMTQTGYINWNAVGITLGLVGLLILLAVFG